MTEEKNEITVLKVLVTRVRIICHGKITYIYQLNC